MHANSATMHPRTVRRQQRALSSAAWPKRGPLCTQMSNRISRTLQKETDIPTHQIRHARGDLRHFRMHILGYRPPGGRRDRYLDGHSGRIGVAVWDSPGTLCPVWRVICGMFCASTTDSPGA